MKLPTNAVFLPAYAYASARSALFTAEFALLNSAQVFMPGGKKFAREGDIKTLIGIRRELDSLLKRDCQNIADGVYPVSVLAPESPLRHAGRFPKIFLDGLAIYNRRARGRTTEFDEQAKEFLDDVPRYYRRNFHFQTGGYLSQWSAKLYEHQVEMLFGGAADAMRRLILKPLRERFGNTDGAGLRFLEIGAGTGRATRFVRQAFPKAKIVALDLSDPYLKEAEKNLSRYTRIDFVRGDGGALPFQDKLFDAAYSVFLFHELPLDARNDVLAESRRVLKKGGFLGLVDALQQGDQPLFDPVLSSFPADYHEPFFRSYLEHPMPALLKKAGIGKQGTDRGFFSKVCWGTRSA